MSEEKLIAIKQLEKEIREQKAEFQKIIALSDKRAMKRKLMSLLKKCHSTQYRSVELGNEPPYDISIQQQIWDLRKEVLDICNMIINKFNEIEK